jgi:hypothetical protein
MAYLQIIQAIWKYKWVLLLALVAIALVAIGIQIKIIDLKNEKINNQSEQINELTRRARVAAQNNRAIAAMYARSQQINKQAGRLKNMSASLTPQIKDCLNNEKITRINDCLGAFFRDGVLPESCAGAAHLPQAAAAGMENRRP